MGGRGQGWLANSVQDGPLTLWGALWPRVQGGPKVQDCLPRLPTGRASQHSPGGTAGWTQGPQKLTTGSCRPKDSLQAQTLKWPKAPAATCRHQLLPKARREPRATGPVPQLQACCQTTARGWGQSPLVTQRWVSHLTSLKRFRHNSLKTLIMPAGYK